MIFSRIGKPFVYRSIIDTRELITHLTCKIMNWSTRYSISISHENSHDHTKKNLLTLSIGTEKNHQTAGMTICAWEGVGKFQYRNTCAI